MLVNRPVVELFTSALRTVAGDALELPERYSAATPATCGVAIDVPLMVFVAVSLDAQAEVMLEPGATMSTHVPKFEKLERASLLVVEPTVMAAPTRAGEEPHASALLLPAATANVTTELIALATAESSVELMPPPRLMLATAGRMRFAATQFT